MKPRIGLIQPGGIGDIIITMPIGKYYVENGYDVFYPIDKRYMDSFQQAAPYINFIPLEATKTISDVILIPREILEKLNCIRIINLLSYMNVNSELIESLPLSEYLKFDQYKYAISGVPFINKWKLEIFRDEIREMRLCELLGVDLTGAYCIAHLEGSNIKVEESQIKDLSQGLKVISITNITSNIFDWLTLIENADKILMIDSCFANLTDQLNIQIDKTLILRSPMAFTPVFGSKWNYAYINEK